MGGPVGEGKGSTQRLVHILQQALQYRGQGAAGGLSVLDAEKEHPALVHFCAMTIIYYQIIMTVFLSAGYSLQQYT